MRIRGKRVGRYFIPGLLLTVISIIGAIIASVFYYPVLNAVSALTFLIGIILTISNINTNDPREVLVPRQSKSRAHLFSAIIMIVFLGIYFILEAILEFDSVFHYWVSGFFGVIGVLMIFITILLWISVYKENIGMV